MKTYHFDKVIQRNPQSRIMIDTAALYGYWERADGSEGGGLWFQREQLPKTGGKLSALELVDYDGAYELPAQVVKLLREHGYVVGSEFDAE